jgi:hypothetical protein
MMMYLLCDQTTHRRYIFTIRQTPSAHAVEYDREGSAHNDIVAHDNCERSEDILHGGCDLAVVVVKRRRCRPAVKDNEAEERSRYHQAEILRYRKCHLCMSPDDMEATYARNCHPENQARNEDRRAV